MVGGYCGGAAGRETRSCAFFMLPAEGNETGLAVSCIPSHDTLLGIGKHLHSSRGKEDSVSLSAGSTKHHTRTDLVFILINNNDFVHF